jgi:hypothetical protein
MANVACRASARVAAEKRTRHRNQPGGRASRPSLVSRSAASDPLDLRSAFGILIPAIRLGSFDFLRLAMVFALWLPV